MKHWKLWSSLVFAAALVVATGCGSKDKNGGGGGGAKSASSPEDAVKYLVEACKAGDMDKVMDQFAEPARDMTKTALEAEKARNAFEDALDAKFGKEPIVRPRRGLQEELKSLQSMEILEKKELDGKDKLELKVKTVAKKEGKDEEDTETMIAVKEGSAWKLYPPGMKPDDAKELPRFREQAQKVMEVTKKLTQEVKDGKFADRQAAYVAFQQAVAP